MKDYLKTIKQMVRVSYFNQTVILTKENLKTARYADLAKKFLKMVTHALVNSLMES